MISLPPVHHAMHTTSTISRVTSTHPIIVAKANHTATTSQATSTRSTKITHTRLTTLGSIPLVPFYSQFTDVVSPHWQKQACGIASLAMIIDYYNPGTALVNTLLNEAIAAGAYDTSAGWTYSGLINASKKYGMSGSSYDLGDSDADTAYATMKTYLNKGPVIASVHYKFDPKSTIPHLVVINGVVGDNLIYNDPAAANGQKTISVADFLKGWKRRFIVVRPSDKSIAATKTISKT